MLCCDYIPWAEVGDVLTSRHIYAEQLALEIWLSDQESLAVHSSVPGSLFRFASPKPAFVPQSASPNYCLASAQTF